MTALPQDALADLYKLVAELEQRLESSFAAHDAAIARATATAQENAELRNELAIARERQNASAEILSAIADTHGDADHALQRIAEATQRFFNAASITIRVAEGDEWVQTVRVGASSHLTGAQPASNATERGVNLPGTVYRENRQIHIPDLDNIDPSMAHWPVTTSRAAGIRTICGSPLRRGGEAIGVLIVYRDQLAPFTSDELELQQSFADQSVIAIENARLFNETRAALERQNASAEILRTIASAPGDAERALYQIAETCAHLFGAPSATIHIAEGDGWAKTIRFGESSKRVGAGVPDAQLKIGGRNMPGTIVGDNRQVNIADVDNVDPAIADWPGLPHVRAAGTRSMSGSPLRRENNAIGALIVYRDRPVPFTDAEMALQQSFADQAAIAIQNARLFNETREALERQTATADILKVIASSPSDAQPVFDAIAHSAKRLLSGFSAAMFRFIDGSVHLAAFTPVSPAADAAVKGDFPTPVDEFEGFRLARHGKPFPIPDTEEIPHAPIREIARLHGFRSMLFVPLMSGGVPIGIISVTRIQPGSFADHHVQLLQTFADQAVIAIENARLFNETQEALERQTATADILRVIAGSPTDVQPVFDAIVSSAARLFEPCSATITTLEDGKLHWKAIAELVPSFDHEAAAATYPIAFDPDRSPSARAILERRIIEIPDVTAPDTPEFTRRVGAAGGFRNAIFVPLIKENRGIGTIILTHPQPGFRLPDKQLALVRTFADQAVIAIENVRLFNEVQQRTDDLSESLQQQTATADVLKVISRSAFDLPSVLDTLVSSAALLCGDPRASIYLLRDGLLHLEAAHNISPEWIAQRRNHPLAPGRDTPSGRAALTGQLDHVPDLLADPDFSRPDLVELGDYRATLNVPLTREGVTVGVLSLARPTPGPFTQRQIELVQTFADQAVIAIENVRLFDEVQAKTRDLSEALTYQTGSANILKVIASSPTEVGPVLQAIVDNACEVCDAYDAAVLLKDGDDLRFNAHHGPIPIGLEKWPINRHWTAGRAVLDKAPVHLHDLLADENADFSDGRELSLRMGHRSILSVPLLRDNESIGAIVLRRTEVNPFSDKQIELLRTFADQAVIAIGNVRLFEEVQARTRDLTESLQQQTATADVLKVISASPGELEPVFLAMLENAVRLCDAKFAMLFLYDQKENVFRGVGKWNLPPAWKDFGKSPLRAHPSIPLGRVVTTKQPVQIADVLLDQTYIDRYPGMVAVAELGGARTLLQVPMLKEDELVGAIGIYRQEVRPFTEKQIGLVRNFAAQAVIAIENARLLNELRQRTDDLTASLDDLRTAQDRLVQTEKLASLGQLTAGIAHEIKNPLNFVNNFAALSAELTDELNDLLKQATIAEKIRDEVDELTGLLKANLQKVVQHGQRADSIVKNMLLHSRDGSGEHRPADINALIDESLNLAYHGARAEKPDFNVTLERDFDAGAGTVEVFPQEITRVFLNLVSNGFYAVNKRRIEAGQGGFDPVLRAATRDLGDAVEIRIRDNGTGIPDEVREKMFNPFFTTKPAGEGTGLGLSMSHDIIVKQHNGTIEVDTEPGHFTEFRIVLPRTSDPANKNRGQT